METLNLNINFENLTTEERKTLMKLIEKSQEKIWKPNNCELYWSTDSALVFNSRWCDCGEDKERYECGNCFRTREEAEEEVTRRKMVTKWERLSIEAGEGENEWDGGHIHWTAYYGHYDNKVMTCSGEWCKYTDIYFPTKESLLDAIKELGEENVKKYILGVRD